MENYNERHNELLAQLKAMDHTPQESVSTKYNKVSTIDLVTDLSKKGFLLHSISGAYSGTIHDEASKHRIEMINPSIEIDGKFASIVVANSYDGRSALSIATALFIPQEQTSVVVSDETLTHSIRHISPQMEQHVEYLNSFLDRLPAIGKTIDHYKEVKVTDEFIQELAREMAFARQRVIWGSKFKQNIFEVDLPTLIGDLSSENTGWEVYIALQQTLMDGDYSYRANHTKKMRKAKGVINPYTRDKINSAIFNLFHEKVVRLAFQAA